MGRASWEPMKTLFMLFVRISAGCGGSGVYGNLPSVDVASDVWVMRESFQAPGPDRTGNWRGWFDRRGCWWEQHNTWLVVSDPDLQRSDARYLYWNALPPKAPWFCLTPNQVEQIRDAINRIPNDRPMARYTQPVDRWVVRTSDDRLAVTVVPRDRPGTQSVPMLALFHQLAAMSVWGQSPE